MRLRRRVRTSRRYWDGVQKCLSEWELAFGLPTYIVERLSSVGELSYLRVAFQMKTLKSVSGRYISLNFRLSISKCLA